MAIEVIASNDAPNQVSCDVIVLGAYATREGFELSPAAQEVDRSLGERLTTNLRDSSFTAKLGEVSVAPTGNGASAKSVAIIGLGEKGKADRNIVRRAAGAAARRLSSRTTLASALHDGIESAAGPAIEGFLLGGYRFTAYKSEPKPTKIERVIALGAERDEVKRAVVLAEATNLARDLINEPASTLTPDELARRAETIAEETGLGCTIVDEDQLAQQGFGGILGVSSGSSEPPRLIVLRHAPEGAATKVAIVGKGITFDSGGLSMKDAKGMETMKTDMSGAAAVIAAMEAVAKLSLPVEVVAYVPASENMPSGTAIKPGDVITHYGGKTTEVLNTDAEGRLVLADALALASEESPTAIVDLATLTGSIQIALGNKSTGLFCNDDTLAGQLKRAAETAGERMWPMPLYEDYRSELESEIADQKNVGTRFGGAILGAVFLQEFVGKGIPWAHLDIAGTARSESDYDEICKGGTGVGTRMLVEWLSEIGP